MEHIPELIKKIVENQARIHAYQIFRYGHMSASTEDYAQAAYEKIWKNDLWSSADHALIFIVARRACMDFSRKIVHGYRERKLPTFVELDREIYQEFDDHYFEVQSLETLFNTLDPKKRMIAEHLRAGYKQKEIGEMLGVTESRINQIWKEILQSLRKQYLKPSIIRQSKVSKKPEHKAKIIPFKKQRRPSKRTCNEEGCNLPHQALGKCKKHYMREYMRNYYHKKRSKHAETNFHRSY